MAWWQWWRRGAARQTGGLAAPSPRRSLFGRQYVAGIPYMLPKDDAEVSRLDLQHFMLRAALRTNYLAPIGQPGAILDVGCGTGRWAMELAAQFPQANVVGVDIVPASPEREASLGYGLARLPENYAFVPGNILEGLAFGPASFDFTHQRLMYSSIPERHWPGTVQELARVTRPGGWVELVEGSLGSVEGQAGPAMRQLFAWAQQVTAPRGINLQIGVRLREFALGAGLRHVTQREVKLPIGGTSRLGAMVKADLVSVSRALGAAIKGAGVADPATFDATLDAWQDEMARYRYSWPVYIVYGQVP
jgi:ubiquinone/menaquinone biosynthesis C-methylase UbiE